MFNLLKISAVAAVTAAAPITASALTTISDDVSVAGASNAYEVIPGELYLSTDIQGDGGPGMFEAKFYYPAANEFDVLNAEARATIGAGTLSAFTGLTMSWHDADGMMTGLTTLGSTPVIPFPDQTVLTTSFADPNFEQILKVSWATSTLNVDFDVVVEVGEVAPVPVPAAGLMLLTALGAAAALRRRA